MTSAASVLSDLTARGIRLSAVGDRLHVEAPAGTLTPTLRAALVEHKAELLEVLVNEAELEAEQHLTPKAGADVAEDSHRAEQQPQAERTCPCCFRRGRWWVTKFLRAADGSILWRCGTCHPPACVGVGWAREAAS